MIRRFFEQELDAHGKKIENGYLFEGLKITECDEEYVTQQERYPVINLSLKAAKQPTYEMAVTSLADEIAKEFKRHRYVLLSEELTESDRERFGHIMNYKAETIEYANLRNRCMRILLMIPSMNHRTIFGISFILRDI